MSPGLTRITNKDLPLVIENDSFRCPKCGRELVVEDVADWSADGRALDMSIRCSTMPLDFESPRFEDWHEQHGGSNPYLDTEHLVEPVREWFNQWYRYRLIVPEVVAPRRRTRTKWRRAA